MYVFYKYGHNSSHKWSPDMIVMAFDVKIDEKNDETPPGACRPLKKLEENHVEKVDPQKAKSKQCRKSGHQKRRKK